MSTSHGGDHQISDTAGIRAMAHPARMAALRHLMKIGPATATELGGVADLTPSAMSYHLRALERAGLIETAPGRGDGRERVWRSVHGGFEVEALDDGSPETRAVSRELLETILAVQEMALRQWLAGADTPGWLDAGFFTETTVMVTEDEMTDLGKKVAELFRPYAERFRTDPPDGARPMAAIFRGFPIDSPEN
jgi:DNA-binding transcriptional ArsR family regulator